jgi:tetrathionate reductase subunit C
MIIMAVIRNLWMMRDETPEARQKDAQLISGLGNFLGAAIVADLFLLFNAVLVILTSSQEAFHAAELLLWGHFAPEFIGVELIIGSLIPLVIVFYPKTKRSFGWLSLASVMTMVGIFAMRFTVVVGGQSVPLH